MTAIEIRGAAKSYGGVRALKEVTLGLEPGEVHALCGENGAGKSTLIKILSGSVAPDSGSIVVGAVPLTPGSVRASEAAGIAVIHQDPVVFPDLDGAENVFAGRELTLAGGLWLDRAAMQKEARALLESLGERFDLARPVGELPLAQRQMVAIARALHRTGGSCRLLVLDEPTASLSQRETRSLFAVIRRLKARGITVLYVSHRLEEIFELSDRVSVLRDGALVGTHPIAGIDRAGLIRLMVGRDAAKAGARLQRPTAPTPTPTGEPILRVRSLSRSGAFENISIEVRPGEIVALAGLVGAGRSEVARAIVGIDRRDAGSVTVAGQELLSASPRAAMSQGVVLVPEDRQREGLILPMPIAVNLSLAVLRALTSLGFISARREREITSHLSGDLAVKAASLRDAVETLSGGNQQKVLLGKWLAASPRVLILDEPTRGVDVGAKAEVHRIIADLASRGVAVLLISSDLPEVLSLSDRIYVMRQGRIAGELSGGATQESVMALAFPADEPVTAGAVAKGPS